MLKGPPPITASVTHNDSVTDTHGTNHSNALKGTMHLACCATNSQLTNYKQKTKQNQTTTEARKTERGKKQKQNPKTKRPTTSWHLH